MPTSIKPIRSSRDNFCLLYCGFPHHLSHTLHYPKGLERDLWRNDSLCFARRLRLLQHMFTATPARSDSLFSQSPLAPYENGSHASVLGVSLPKGTAKLNMLIHAWYLQRIRGERIALSDNGAIPLASHSAVIPFRRQALPAASSPG